MTKRADLLQGKQLPMFTDGDDLPLFSGTAQRTTAEVFTPREVARQQSMAACSICLDTGRVEGHYCTCAAGTRAREDDRTEREAEQRAEYDAFSALW